MIRGKGVKCGERKEVPGSSAYFHFSSSSFSASTLNDLLILHKSSKYVTVSGRVHVLLNTYLLASRSHISMISMPVLFATYFIQLRSSACVM